MHKKILSAVSFFVFILCFAALSRADGPKIIFDLKKLPFPDVPFPNDAFTQVDETSPTGMRILIPPQGITKSETRLRQQLLTLDGFSTYGPIVVSFDKPLDLMNIRKRHNLAERADNPFRDNAVFVINIQKGSKNYGKAVPLDLGDGNFPVVLENTEHFLNDTRGDSSNMVFETVDEEALGKDTNFDGRISKPNLMPRNGDPYKDLVTFYDMNTNTLIIRVLYPLEERSQYAVVLTKRLVGENGEPVASPDGLPYQEAQKDGMEKFLNSGILKNVGIAKNDVAFAWSFTTQSVTADLVAIRSGLYGYGPFKKLAQDFPVDGSEFTLDPMKEEGQKNKYLFDGSKLALFMKVGASLIGLPISGETVSKFTKAFEKIDYVISGTYTTPYFLENDSGINHYSEEVFHVNTKTGAYKAHKAQVDFILCVPKATPQHKPPFPVTFIGHGYTMNRLMTLAVCGIMAEEGFAAFGIDAAGHGTGDMKRDIEKFLQDKNASGMIKNMGLEPVLKALSHGRDRDLNGDGIPDSGADYWTAYVFHSRDMARQTMIDHMQIVRIMRSFDGKHTWNLDSVGMGKLAGDFNGDGVVDIGGPEQYYSAMGISLGGIHTAILPAIEPAIKVSVPIVGGGGLVDLGIRSLQGGVPQGVTLRLMGPLLVDVPDDKGDEWLAFQVTDINTDTKITVAKIKDMKEGDWLTLKNENNGVERFAVADAQKKFRIGIPCDAGDKLTLTLYDGDRKNGKVKQTFTTFEVDAKYQSQNYKAGDALVSPVDGFGMIRNTPEYREFMVVAQMVLDPADPINYAPHYFLDPLDIKPEGKVMHNVLVMPTVGDMNVPVNTGIAIARAAGILPMTWNEAVKKDYFYGPSKTAWNDAKNYDAWLKNKMTWQEMNAQYKKDGKTTPNQILLDNYVIEGLEKMKRFSEKPDDGVACVNDSNCRFGGTCKDGLCYIKILSDPDDLAEGKTGFNNPRITPPLRITLKTKSGISALRIPYGHPSGSHFFNPFGPAEYYGVKSTFDLGTYMINEMKHYFMTGGKELYDDPCLEKSACK